MPEELNYAKEFLNKFEEKSIKLFEENFENSDDIIQKNIRNLAKLENINLVNCINSLQENNFEKFEIKPKIENDIIKLINKIKQEKQR